MQFYGRCAITVTMSLEIPTRPLDREKGRRRREIGGVGDDGNKNARPLRRCLGRYVVKLAPLNTSCRE
ncbi:Hypothetical protein NTJ_00603 [Nesidiocoris tenuis]|uniref:Uncharacterized protein n=1 Tax=Nesidiocoris tenuis TaxID=355587 RepID=A0ABN7A990_9HEMI|nr:Hypothetical protein NTJ_00603 [Nesidiocoris tenuis]